jgi:hypothetical protein
MKTRNIVSSVVLALVLVACGGAPHLVRPPRTEAAVDVKFALMSNAQTSAAYHGKRVHTYAVFNGAVPLIQDSRFSSGFQALSMAPSDMQDGKAVCGLPVGQINTFAPAALSGDVASAKMGAVFEITGVLHKNDVFGSGGSLEVETLKVVGQCA